MAFQKLAYYMTIAYIALIVTKEEQGAFSLSGDFEGLITVDPSNGTIKLDVSDITGIGVEIITKQSVYTQPNEFDATSTETSTSTAKTFDPRKSLVNVGQFQLNTLSPYLFVLPDHFKANLLAAPQSGESLLNLSDFRDFNTYADRISEIDGSDGIHYNGQDNIGMPLVDSLPIIHYEENWALEVQDAWDEACQTGQPIVTDLAIGTRPIVESLRNGLEGVNDILRRQGGEEIKSSLQLTSTTSPTLSHWILAVDLSDQGPPSKTVLLVKVLRIQIGIMRSQSVGLLRWQYNRWEMNRVSKARRIHSLYGMVALFI